MTTKIGSSTGCCCCFGRKKEIQPEKPHLIQRSANFAVSNPRDISEIITVQIDDKAQKEAVIVNLVYKEAEK